MTCGGGAGREGAGGVGVVGAAVSSITETKPNMLTEFKRAKGQDEFHKYK